MAPAPSGARRGEDVSVPSLVKYGAWTSCLFPDGENIMLELGCNMPWPLIKPADGAPRLMRNSASLSILAPDWTLKRLIAAFPRADIFFAAAVMAADTAAGELGARGLLVCDRFSKNAAAISIFFCGETTGVMEPE